MSSFDLVINGKTVKANYGETLVDAGLSGWVAIPHDCCSGQCETCRVSVVSGRVDDSGTSDKGTVLACQAKVIANASITFDHVADVAKRSGLVTGVTTLTSDIVEVTVTLATPIDMRPGQYLSVKFAGFPPRELSPTVRFDGTAGPGELVFHIRRYPGGLVSTQIGATIKPGHRVQVRGPFGNAFLRDGDGPLVLIGGGTGWAPIWSIASAARREQRHREIIVIAGSRDAEGLYMRRSLEWLIDDGVRDVIAVAETGATNSGAARQADPLPAVTRTRRHGVRRRPAAAGGCHQGEVARRGRPLLCRPVPAERAAALADRSRHGDAAPAGCRAGGTVASGHRAVAGCPPAPAARIDDAAALAGRRPAPHAGRLALGITR